MLILCVGLLFMAAGIYGFFKNRSLARTGLRADAEVVDLHIRVSYDGETGTSRTYYPIVRFRTADGQEVQARTRAGGSPPPARPGDQVRVVYQPGNPQTVSIDTVMGRGVAPMLLFVIVGLGITVFQVYRMAR